VNALLVVDLSAIVHMMWHVSTNDPNPDAASIKTVERVRALASGQPRAVICCDHPSPSFRREIDPRYKANRKAEDRAPLYHQMRLAIDTLKADGFYALEVKGMEADDLIGSIVAQVSVDTSVLIATRDKDLLQLVTPTDRVLVKWLDSGNLVDAAAVKAKLGVEPHQVGDYLALCGDASDNVPGCDGIGSVWAGKILAEFGSLENLWNAFDAGATPTITAGRRTKLQDFRRDVWPTTRQLIALKTDVPIDFDEIFKPRVPTGDDVAVFDTFEEAGEAFHVAATRAFDEEDDCREAQDNTPSLGPFDGVPMQNKPTPAQVADVREASESLFANNRADVEADIAAAMPDKPDVAVLTPGVHFVHDAAAQLAVKQETPNATRSANAEDRPQGQPVVRDDALYGNDRHRPGNEQPDAVSRGEGGARSHRPDGARNIPVSEGTISGQRAQDGGSQALTPVVVDYERALEPRSLAEAYKLAQSMFQARLFSSFGNADAVLSVILAGREFGIQAMASLRSFHVLDGKPTLSSGLIHALVLKSGKAKYFRCIERTPERATFETQRGDDPPMKISYSVEDARRGWTKGEDSFKKSGWGRVPEDMCVARALSKLARLVFPDVLAGVYSSEEFDQ